jgi:hypothetical protein
MRVESIGLDGISILGISGIFIESVVAGVGCIFIPPIAGADFLTVFAEDLPVPALFAFVVLDVAFFFWVFLPIGMFVGICIPL